MAVDRDGIKNGFYQDMARQAEAAGLLKPLTLQERQQSRDDMLVQRPEGSPVWVFGYGSLIWNPAFHFVEQRRAHLFGYHRSFCLQTPIGRGSQECPGLVLGLDRGGSVQGVAFRIAEDVLNEELDVIWSREMLAGSYRPTWVSLKAQNGDRIPAITFVMRRDSERYAGKLSFEETARTIAAAQGSLGPCSDYLERTVEALDHMGIGDGPMHRLQHRVRLLKSELS